MKFPSHARSAIGILLLLALVVRLPGIWQNLPFVFHWDEPTLVNLAVWLFTDHSLNPHFFNYPGGMIYLLGLLFALVLLVGLITGQYDGLGRGIDFLSAGTYPRPPGGAILYRFPTQGVPILYILGRLVSAVLGTLSVWWVFRLAEFLAGSRAAWAAACLLALSALHAANSAVVTTDVACGALLTWFLLSALTGRSPRRSGLILGLAAAFKYTAGIGVYLWPLGLLWPPGGDRRGWNRYWLRLLPWAAAAFLLLNPFSLLTPRAFLRDLLYESGHMRSGTAHFGQDLGIGPTGPSVVTGTLGREFGILPLIGLAAGLFLGWTRSTRGRTARDTGRPEPDATSNGEPRVRRREIGLLGAWCLVYLVQLLTWKTVYPRYLLPIWPALCVVAGYGWTAGSELLLPRRFRARLRPGLLIGLLVLPGLLPLGRSLAARSRTDPRVELSRYLRSALEPGATVTMEPGGPYLSSDDRAVVSTDLLGRATPEGWRRQGVRYLIGTGREQYLPGGGPDSLRRNREKIDAFARVLWRRGPYVVYDLGAGDGEMQEIRKLMANGKPAEAQTRAVRLCRADSTDGLAAMLLGETSLAVGDTSSAVDAFSRAAELRLSDATPLLALGNLALEAGEYDLAVEAFSQAQQRAPRDAVTANNLATALLYRAQEQKNAGRSEEAALDLRKAHLLTRLALSLDPRDARFIEQEKKSRELAARWRIFLPHEP